MFQLRGIPADTKNVYNVVFELCFDQKKGQKVRFQTEFQEKQTGKKRQFSQNVTVFIQGTACFFTCFLTKKRAKGEISVRMSGKTTKNDSFQKT